MVKGINNPLGWFRISLQCLLLSFYMDRTTVSAQHGLCPFVNGVDISSNKFSIYHAEKQLGLGIFYGIVIDVGPICQFRSYVAINDRAIVAGYDFGDWHIVAAFHDSLGNSCSIDSRAVCRDEKQANEEARLFCSLYVVDLLRYRKNRLKYKALLFCQTILPQILTIFHRLHDGILIVPIAKFLLGNDIRVDIYCILQPLMM